MYGATGTHPKTGKKISVMGSGMGMSSLGIYVHELIDFYKVKTIIRLGSAGGLTTKTPCRSIVIAMGACTDSAINLRRFSQMSFARIADWNLLRKAVESAEKQNISYKVGNIISADTFYEIAQPRTYDAFKDYNVLAIEMETAELYTLAAKHNVQALTILTISNNFETEEDLTQQDRESSFSSMVSIALGIE